MAELFDGSEVEEVAPQPRLKPFPFHDGYVNENAAVRVIRMVKPECPNDTAPTIVRKDGSEIPNPRYTGQPKCQEVYKFNNYGRWDVEKCLSLGHEPYYTTFRTTIVEDVLDEDGYVVESKPRVKVEKRLNVIQVSDSIRQTSKTEVQLALARGCKFMHEFGYESPCEFRNCTGRQNIRTRYGNYCSERHARLIAADEREIMLVVGGDPFTEDKAAREREEQLGNISLGVISE